MNLRNVLKKPLITIIIVQYLYTNLDQIYAYFFSFQFFMCYFQFSLKQIFN